ncbi:replicative DNA helicase [Paenibacillus methanolicus]|uniref:DNA 5'-3' helicase n=1 Tax=Paenibacillus methanolicus TaxID=582686 RepID=A0A5S5BRT5_9BACL|nr:replicative DNA helicase [Paenibacillus methanolicus]TYP68902.1 replicative DNA helicase [Paenibacillus methanolicus]
MNYEAEAAVLGAILNEPERLEDCYLQPEDMGDERHRLILQYLYYLAENDIPINYVAMAEHSGQNLMRIGGVSYLTELAGGAPPTNAATFDHHQDIIRQHYITRETLSALETVQNEGRGGKLESSELLAAAQERLEKIAEMAGGPAKETVRKMSAVVADHEKVIIKRQQQRGMTGAKTASKELDRLTGGHQDGDLEIVAARPSIGKTAFVVNDMLEAARAGRQAVLFSLEMPADKVIERFLCCMGNIDATKMRTGQFSDRDWEHWSYAMDELDRLPLYIDDTPGRTVLEIKQEIKRLKKQFPGIVIYVDYLQLVQPGRKFSQTREGVTFVSRQLKQAARVNQCPVIAISSVSRSCEQRQDKRPIMSDLKESGDIEFEADIIAFLFRDDYYNPETEKKNIMEIIIAKGRNVGTGTVEMIFYRKTGRFLDIDRNKAGTDGAQQAAK